MGKLLSNRTRTGECLQEKIRRKRLQYGTISWPQMPVCSFRERNVFIYITLKERWLSGCWATNGSWEAEKKSEKKNGNGSLSVPGGLNKINKSSE